jgi:hypothetical protein
MTKNNNKRQNRILTKKKLNADYTKQLNLKISSKLIEEVEIYSKEFGYNNAQEVIREAIRDKVFGSDNVRADYLERLFAEKDFQESIGKEQSKIELEKLRKRGLDE